MADTPNFTNEFTDELKIKLKSLYDTANTTPINEISQFQINHQKYINQHYYPFICQFEMYFSMLVDVSYNLNYINKKHWPINRGFQYVMATHSLKQFYSAYELFLDGFYDDAISLQRSIYESFLRIVYVSCNPKTPHNAYTTKGEKGPKFNATNFVKKELGLDWESYSIMSAFAHSNKYRVMGEMVDNIMKGQKEPVALKYEVDKNMISVVLNYFLFLFVIFLGLFSEVFTVVIDDYKNQPILIAQLQKLREYAETARLTLKSHSENNYWRKTGKELDYIFELIKTLDKNPSLNWKKEWAIIYSKDSTQKSSGS